MLNDVIRKTTTAVLCAALGLIAAGAFAQQSDTEPVIVVLNVEGEAQFARQSWTAPQALAPGTQISPQSPIYSDGANIRAVCADGRVRDFMPQPNETIQCPQVDGTDLIIGEQPGTRRLTVSRGGAENPVSPYLIEPRATVVRTPQVTLRWNALEAASAYTVTVRADGEVAFESGEIDASIVNQEGGATVPIPVTLSEGVAYSVEICVLGDGETRCTTDPGLASSANLSFFYDPLPALTDVEAQLTADLGDDNPQALFARAVLLSQPVNVGTEQEVGPYADAIALLEQLLTEYPDSQLAQSAEVYNLLGELYQNVQLNRRAAVAYTQAVELAPADSETAAEAQLGLAATTLDPTQTVSLYDGALDSYAAFLNESAFDDRFRDVCGLVGDICLDLARCQERMDDCAVWFREG